MLLVYRMVVELRSTHRLRINHADLHNPQISQELLSRFVAEKNPPREFLDIYPLYKRKLIGFLRHTKIKDSCA